MYHQADNQGLNEIGSTPHQTYALERAQPIWGEVAKSAKPSYLPDLFITDNISDVAAPAQSAKVDIDFLLAQELISDLLPPRRYRS